MKRLPRVVLVTTAVILLLCALVLTGLRFLLPNIDSYRQDIIAYIEKNNDVTVQIGKIEGAWQYFYQPSCYLMWNYKMKPQI